MGVIAEVYGEYHRRRSRRNGQETYNVYCKRMGSYDSIRTNMKLLKISIAVLFLFSLAVLGVASVVFMGKKAEETLRLKAEDQLDTQRSENKKLTLAYDQLNQQKQQIEKQLEEEKTRAQGIFKDLQSERSNRSKAEEDLNKVREDYQKLSQELEILQQKYQDLETQGFQPLETAPGKLKTEVELPPVVVSSEPRQKGKVLVVNRDFNFIVADLGYQDKLEKGSSLSLTRNGKPVARVQAEKVYDQFSACTIIEESKSNPILEGDLVTKS